MSLDSAGFKKCNKCENRYHENLKQCPHCGYKPLLRYINGTVVFGAITATLIGAVLLVYANIPIAANNIAQDQITDNTDNEIRRVEYYYEEKTEPLLDHRAFLLGGDRITFDLLIPNRNVTTLNAVISVDGSNYLDVEFQDSSGRLYCDQCKIRAYGDTSYAIHDAIRINVNEGDSIKVVVASPKDWVQTFHINLQVGYLEQNQRIVSSVSDNE